MINEGKWTLTINNLELFLYLIDVYKRQVKGRLPTETSDSELASDMEPCKPVIQVPLKDFSVFEGMKARLDCVIVGQPEPEVNI